MRLIISFICSIIITSLSIVLFYNHLFINNSKQLVNDFYKVLYIDRSFNVQQKSIIKIAAMEWQKETNNIVRFDVEYLPTLKVIDPTNAIIIHNVSPDNPDIIFLDGISNTQHLGLCQMDEIIPNIEIVASRIHNVQSFKATILHELGHAIGLKHNEGITGIQTLMFPSLDLGADFITEEDLKNFCKIYNCKNKLKY